MSARTPPSLRNKTIAVIGLGQIGGSIVKCLSASRPTITLLAHDRDRRVATRVSRHAEWVTDLLAVVDRSDVVILATPVPTIIALLKQVAALRKPNDKKLLVLGTGTVKLAIHKEAARHRGQFTYIGLHPLAGVEGEGWDCARDDLFVGKPMIVSPPSDSRLPLVRDLIRLLGAIPLPMEARTHDRLVAEAIGLPHLLAFAAQGMSSDNPLTAGSWASLTRVAASNPEMVAGFLYTNAAEQKRALARFERELSKLKAALDDRSGRLLLKLIADRQRTQG